MTPAASPSLVQSLSRRWRHVEAGLQTKVGKAGPDEQAVDRLCDKAEVLQLEIEAQMKKAHSAGPDDAAAILDVVLAMWAKSGGPGCMFDDRDAELVKLARAALRRKPTGRNGAGRH